MKELIGKKVKGFKFKTEDFKYVYHSLMDEYINEIGVIIHVSDSGKICEVRFEDNKIWSYPTELIQKQLQQEYDVTMIVEAPKEEVKGLTNNLAFIDNFNPKEEKPKHYANGIDTFARMEANCTLEECLAFAKGNIDKYNFRTKGQDLEDYTKIIAYANWAIKLLNKK